MPDQKHTKPASWWVKGEKDPLEEIVFRPQREKFTSDAFTRGFWHQKPIVRK